MDITVQRDALVRELALADSIVSRKPTLAVLGSVLFQAEGDGLRLSATDLELTVRSQCPTERLSLMGDSRQMAVPARKLFELVRSFPDSAVRLQQDGMAVGLTAAGFKGRLQAQPTDDFPVLPAPTAAPAPLAQAGLLRDLMLRTMFATTDEDERYMLAGALMEVEAGTVRMVATDGHRLAVASGARGAASGLVSPAAFLPRKTMAALVHFLDGVDAAVGFAAEGNHLFFSVPGRLLVSRTVDGQFPTWQRIVPKSFAMTAEAGRANLLGALRRSLMVADTETRRVSLALADGCLAVAARSALVGDGEDRVDLLYRGEPVSALMNGTYVEDFLDAAGTDEVQLRFNEGGRSVVGFGAVGGDVQYDYYCMPQVA